MSKATTEKLGTLHGVIAEELVRRIQEGEASAADIGAAIKFLNDNGITADIDNNDHLKGLKDQLAERAARREQRRLRLVGEDPKSDLTDDEVDEVKQAASGG